jgi:hypothetical protein
MAINVVLGWWIFASNESTTPPAEYYPYVPPPQLDGGVDATPR